VTTPTDNLQDFDHLCAWMRLAGTPGVGRGTARELLAKFGPPQDILAQGHSALTQHLPQAMATALKTESPEHVERVVVLRAWLQADATRCVIAMDDARFPRQLLDTADPPLMLFAQGDVALLQAPSIAIVGSRNTTAQGSDNARAFARSLSQSGYTVVSGLALGIDGAAHEGALLGAASGPAGGVAKVGSTIAVVGTGLDRIYPAKHAPLARDIAAHGLLLSEFFLGTPPLAENFPQRNRIIAGLAQGTLVVEAALRSGSLITASMAIECGREVFAIPGSIHSPQSHGCHALIKQGAKLVETAQDVLEELSRSVARRPAGDGAAPSDAANATQADNTCSTGSTGHAANAAPRAAGLAASLHASLHASLLDAMGFDPVTLDAVLARTGLPTASAQAQLWELEMEGAVHRLPGGRFQRRVAG
jgi:DNA processing protein